MTKNAKREDVKKKLSESLNYCNSHHIPAQELFESIADRTINNETCRYDAEKKKRNEVTISHSSPSRNLSNDSLDSNEARYTRIRLESIFGTLAKQMDFKISFGMAVASK